MGKYSYCLESTPEKYFTNLRLISGILDREGFDSTISLKEDTDFDYTSDKPLDETTLSMLRSLPGIERVVARQV